jgi:hypothetical protein
MNTTQDPLYEIFEKHLNYCFTEGETNDEFIYRVVSEYIFHLFNQGHIPKPFEDKIEEDIREEVEIMIKKKTYGHFNLDEFRKEKKIKPSSIMTETKKSA